MKWRILKKTCNSAYKNMAIDEAILFYCRQEIVPSTIRFYTWEIPCVTMGYFQKLNEIKKIFPDPNLKFVRRMTGGGTVLHGADLAVSIVCRYEELGSRNIMDSYQKISSAISQGLHNFGIHSEVGTTGVSYSSECFKAPQPGDVIVGKKKLAGGAQRRSRGFILYQGSILLRKQAIKKTTSAKSISLEEVISGNIDLERFQASLICGFKKKFGITTKESLLLDQETILAKKLEKKYRSDIWNSTY